MPVLAAPRYALVLPLSGLALWPAELDGGDAIELRTGHGELLGVLHAAPTADLRVGIAVAREATGDRQSWTVAAGSAPLGLPVQVDFRPLNAPVPTPDDGAPTAQPALRIGPWWFAEVSGVLPAVVAVAARVGVPEPAGPTVSS